MSDHEGRVDIDRIGVASPCSESWDGMEGDERVRYCDRCALNVYNLSDLTRDQASDLVSAAEGRLCVRFFKRDDGTMLTRDCPVGLARRTGRFVRAIAASLLALLGFLPSCGSDSSSPKPQPGSETVSPDDPHELQPLQGEIIKGAPDEIEIIGDVEFVGRMVVPHVPQPPENSDR